jgi:hypothetical protein
LLFISPEWNKKSKNDCKNKGMASLFNPQKQAGSIPKKVMPKPLPEWAKDLHECP